MKATIIKYHNIMKCIRKKHEYFFQLSESVIDKFSETNCECDIKIICQDGSFYYSRIMLALLLPNLVTILMEECSSCMSYLFFPELDVVAFREAYHGFEEVNNHGSEAIHVQDVNGENSHLYDPLVQKTSENERSFICDFCGKCYFTKDSLKKHIDIVHSTEKYNEYKCSVCEKTFSHKFLLKKHCIKHKVATPYMCTVCGTEFKRECDLTHHLINFHNKTLIDCDVCDTKFRYKKDLLRHKRTKHDQIKYNCEFCRTSFSRKDSLKRHINTIHV